MPRLFFHSSQGLPEFKALQCPRKMSSSKASGIAHKNGISISEPAKREKNDLQSSFLCTLEDI